MEITYSIEDTTSQMGVWEDLSSNIPTGIGSNFDNFYAQGSYNLTIAISPFNENHIFLGGTNLIYLPMALLLWIM